MQRLAFGLQLAAVDEEDVSIPRFRHGESAGQRAVLFGALQTPVLLFLGAGDLGLDLFKAVATVCADGLFDFVATRLFLVALVRERHDACGEPVQLGRQVLEPFFEQLTL